MRTRIAPRRGGFTLIELLVAMGLALALLGIAIAASQTSIYDSYKVVGGGDRISQWLVTAKGKAARDRALRGLRFLGDPTVGQSGTRSLVSECVYIEEPEPARLAHGTSFVVDYLWHPGTLPQDSKYGHKRIWVSNGTLGDFDYYPQATRPAVLTAPKVQIGDTVSIPNVGRFRIAQITVVGAGTRPDYPPTAAPQPSAVQPTAPADDPAAPNPVSGSSARAAFQLFLADPVANPGSDGTSGAVPTQPSGYMLEQVNILPDLGTMNGQTIAGVRYAGFQTGENDPITIFRQPQPLVGEATLQLARGMVVDFEASDKVVLPVGSPGGYRRVPALRAVNGPPGGPDDPAGPTAYTLDRFDILFAPSGEVIRAEALYRHRTQPGTYPPKFLNDRIGLYALVLRDRNKRQLSLDLTVAAETEEAGEMVIVAVYAGTGAIATHPRAQGTDPFQFVKDGINTGL